MTTRNHIREEDTRNDDQRKQTGHQTLRQAAKTGIQLGEKKNAIGLT